MRELLERMEARQAGKAKAGKATAKAKRGTVYSESDISVTVRLNNKEFARLFKQRKLVVKARDANGEPNTYTVTIELGGKGVSSV